MNRDLVNSLKVISSLAPVVRTATANGTAADNQGAQSEMIVFNVGTPGITLTTSNYIELQVQESDDNSTFVACPDANLSAVVTGSATGTVAKLVSNSGLPAVFKVGYMGSARYVRAIVTYTGTHGTGTPISASIVQGNLDYRPASGNAS